MGSKKASKKKVSKKKVSKKTAKPAIFANRDEARAAYRRSLK